MVQPVVGAKRQPRRVGRGLELRSFGLGKTWGSLVFALVFCSFPVVGCGSVEKKSRVRVPGPRIDEVSVQGVSEEERTKLLQHLNLQPSSWPGNNYYYLPGLEHADSARILEYFRSQGYYHAEVLDIEVEIRNRDEPIKRQRADVQIRVDRGPPTRIGKIDWEWPSETTPAKLSDAVQQRPELKVGRIFRIQAFNAAAKRATLELRELGYHRARVKESAQVNLQTRQAKLRFRVEPGPRLPIEKVQIRGLNRVSPKYVEEYTSAVKGQYSSLSLSREIQSSVYGIGVFATVSVRYTQNESKSGLIMHVDVTERAMTKLEAGVELNVDPVLWRQAAGIRYEHLNLGSRLVRLNTHVKAGWAETPNPWSPRNHGPIVDIAARFSKKGLFERRLVWTLYPRLSSEIRPGYRISSVHNQISVARPIRSRWHVALSYHNRLALLQRSLRGRITPGGTSTSGNNSTDDRQPNTGAEPKKQDRDSTGPWRNPYILSYLEARAEFFLVDNIADPRNGIRALVTYQLALRALGSNFEYQKFVPELRGYYEWNHRFRALARTRIGWILPLGERGGAPMDQRFYLGGGQTIRGWPLTQVSPKDRICDFADPMDCERVPVGGNTEFLANLELQARLWTELWGAIFFDFGDVKSEVAKIRPAQWVYTMGPGLRYRTPVGAIRLDFGVHLHPVPIRFVPQKRWAIHFSLGDVF